MFSLSQTVGYAIQALSCLAKNHPRSMVAKDIAACTGIPLPYLSKFIHTLKDNALIEAKRGYQGGFTLARPAEEISLLDVAHAVDGPNILPHCMLGLPACTAERSCPTHAFWKEERAKIEAVLRNTTVADVVAYQGECCQWPPEGSEPEEEAGRGEPHSSKSSKGLNQMPNVWLMHRNHVQSKTRHGETSLVSN